ncbi:MAG: hypothetical protein JHC81_04860 [Brevundimonas sp.]|uniref:hypothetical protein n=1 Tax=Brevundimonas sp. TaxID=1871086 RepID=UPI001A1D0AAB|nr:hypothetical protein [Brevundimonas sp.]MBJ7446845.1 hypothetical protein [Brevundimonas sp.]
MTKTTLLMCAAAHALAFASPDTGSGTGAAPGGADPIDKADPAPAPQDATTTAPAEPHADPKAAPVGNAKGADVSPPNTSATANKVGKRVYMVWVQPGHETLGVGQLIAVPKDSGESLRTAGRARFASDAEVKAAKAGEADTPGLILTLDGV